jgi:hypothetical protein
MCNMLLVARWKVNILDHIHYILLISGDLNSHAVCQCSLHDIFNIVVVPAWSYSSWIYNYLCNQCLSPLKLWIRTPFWRDVLDTALYDKVCQWLVAGRWFSPGIPVFPTNKTERHNIAEILLKVALNTINLTLTLQLVFSFFLSATSSPADCMGTFACSAKCKSAYKKGSDGCPKCDCLKFSG